MDTKDFPEPFRRRMKRAARKLRRRFRQFPGKLSDRSARLIAIPNHDMVKAQLSKEGAADED